MSVIPNSQKISAIARLKRHERVFGKDSIVSAGLKQIQENGASLMTGVSKVTGIRHVGGALKHAKNQWRDHVAPPTASTLYKRVGVLAVGLMMVTAVLGSTFDVTNAQYSDDTLAQATQDGTLVADQDGYITKVNPQTTKAERTFKDIALYSVASGDTLSGIAKEFNLHTETLMWENGLTTATTLKVGQKLNIPPSDGVSHQVAAGQTLEKIAALYSVPTEKIIAMNNIQNGVIGKDQIIFVPDGKPLPETKPAILATTSARTVASAAIRSPARDSAARNVRTTVQPAEKVSLKSNDNTPAAGKFLIFPTIGSLTQGFHKGHYAFDIANRSRPPIWAAAGGTVVTATMGVWAGGYGNHVVIDHGNGIKTLYGHMTYVSVKVGDHVTQGQVLGQMGNTGNVRGITGIHLHFEVIDHGVKKTPSLYY